MADEGEIHVGQTVTFRPHMIDQDGVDIDISAATSLTVRFWRPAKPSRTVLVRNGTLDSTGLDGRFYYTTTTSDLDRSGTWGAQPWVVTPTRTIPGKIHYFEVLDNVPSS